MNQKELIEAVRVEGAMNNGLIIERVTKKEAEAWLEAVFDVLIRELVGGGEVSLPNVGKLKSAQKAARTGRNPATGEALSIPAKTVIKFVPAKALKDALA